MTRRANRLHNGAWEALRQKALRRDNFRCVLCQTPGRLEVDHIIPKAKGGTDNLTNLQTLCRGCHIQKTRTERGYPPRYKSGWKQLVEELR